MEPEIVFEDDQLLLLNKPSGWVVNDAQTTVGQNTIQNWLSKLDYPLSKSHEFRSGIVHRLDKETSGLLIVAKTENAFSALQGQFKERVVEKAYTTLVHGKIEPPGGVVSAPVGRLPWNRRRFGILPGGRPSESSYKLVNYYSRDDEKHGELYSLLEVFPKTGRTHQIRIHMKYKGHPVVGDTFYAGRKTSRNDRKWCERLFLHASRIAFDHPTANKRMNFEAELPQDLLNALEALEIVSVSA